MWNLSNYVILNLKEAYSFLSPHAKAPPIYFSLIWKFVIPPSRLFILWCLLHDKLPMDEHLCRRDCITVSSCNMCCLEGESCLHLFLNCPFAKELWTWLGSIFKKSFGLTSIKTLLSQCVNVSSIKQLRAVQ